MKLPEKILYAHEHTTIDLSGPKKNIDCRLDDFDATAAEYRRLAEHGVVGIIDQTNRGMGRNVAYVQKMAAQAGVEITHATGYYKEPFLPPECYTLTDSCPPTLPAYPNRLINNNTYTPLIYSMICLLN